MPWFNWTVTPRSRAHAKTGGCGLSPAPSSMAMNMSSCDCNFLAQTGTCPSLSQLLLGIFSGMLWGASQLCACGQACLCKGSPCPKWGSADALLFFMFKRCLQDLPAALCVSTHQGVPGRRLRAEPLLQNHWNQEKPCCLGGAGRWQRFTKKCFSEEMTEQASPALVSKQVLGMDVSLGVTAELIPFLTWCGRHELCNWIPVIKGGHMFVGAAVLGETLEPDRGVLWSLADSCFSQFDAVPLVPFPARFS